jgi:hypothetical protein
MFELKDTNEKVEDTKDIAEADLTYNTHKAGWHLAQYLENDINTWIAKQSEPVTDEDKVANLLSAAIDVAVTGIAQLGYKFTNTQVVNAAIDAVNARQNQENMHGD